MAMLKLVCVVLIASMYASISTSVSANKAACLPKADVVFLVDSSASIVSNGDHWKTLKHFIKQITIQIHVGINHVRVGIVNFSTTSSVELYLDQSFDYNEVLTAIQFMTFKGGATHLEKALKDAYDSVYQETRGDRPDVPNVVIIITDGSPSGDSETTLNIMEELRKKARLVPVGVTANVGYDFLLNVSTNADEIVQVPNFELLDNSTETLIDIINICKYNSSGINLTAEGRVITNQKCECQTVNTIVAGCSCTYKWLTFVSAGLLALVSILNLICCCNSGFGLGRGIPKDLIDRYPEPRKSMPIYPVFTSTMPVTKLSHPSSAYSFYQNGVR